MALVLQINFTYQRYLAYLKSDLCHSMQICEYLKVFQFKTIAIHFELFLRDSLKSFITVSENLNISLFVTSIKTYYLILK